MLEKEKRHPIQYRNRAIGITCVVILVVSLLASFSLWKRQDIHNYDNNVRIQLREMEDTEFPRLEVDLEGKVTYAEEPWKEKQGDHVVVQELLQRGEGFAKEYPGKSKIVYTKESDGRVEGFIAYLLPEELAQARDAKQVLWWCLTPFLIGVLLIVLILLGFIYVTNRHMIKPMEEISKSASYIIKGDYSYEVLRVHDTKVADNEIGKLIYYFELMRDELRVRREREEELKHSQQELISCISHDLKTPLSTIKAYAEGMRDGIATTEDDRRKYTEIIISKTDLIIGMIEDLLEYSNSQLNKLEVVRKELYFRPYFDALMQELEIYVNNAGIAFDSQCMFEDCVVEMDERRIEEVFYNLVENSMKYCCENNPKIWITAEHQKNEIVFHVKDNGVGIHSADIPYVFDKFYRAEKSRSSQIPGSGLGLSICKYIIEQHGGEIRCMSKKNEGCDMIFSIRV